MQDLNVATAEGQKGLIASAEAKLKESECAAADAAERREAARERLVKLKHGESVSGGMGKKLDVNAMLKAAGFTARELKRMQLQASLTGQDFETVLQRTKPSEVIDKAFDREVRRLVRKRS
jgi:hypothetical protein